MDFFKRAATRATGDGNRDPRTHPRPGDEVMGRNKCKTVIAVGYDDDYGQIVVTSNLRNGKEDVVGLVQWRNWAADAY